MTKSGFDLDEIERRARAFLFQECQPDRGDVFSWMDDRMADFIRYALHNSAPAMLTEIRELRATVATLGDSARAGANVLDAKDAEISELRAENARLRGKVSDALAFLRSAPLESGYCCCGSPVDGHSIGDGHAPVDALAYYASNLASDLSAALGEPQ